MVPNTSPPATTGAEGEPWEARGPISRNLIGSQVGHSFHHCLMACFYLCCAIKKKKKSPFTLVWGWGEDGGPSRKLGLESNHVRDMEGGQGGPGWPGRVIWAGFGAHRGRRAGKRMCALALALLDLP